VDEFLDGINKAFYKVLCYIIVNLEQKIKYWRLNKILFHLIIHTLNNCSIFLLVFFFIINEMRDLFVYENNEDINEIKTVCKIINSVKS
jgi:hypothetical protein